MYPHRRDSPHHRRDGVGGTLLTDHLLATDVGTLRLFDDDEAELATARSRLDEGRCRFLPGDVRDATCLRYAMADVDIVIHAAAMTHVDAVEITPVEAVTSTVFGTHHVIETAIDAGVERVLRTSSDTAVDPANTMGMTTLLAETPVSDRPRLN